MSSKIDCVINCDTLTCDRCKKKSSSCDIKRNCRPWEDNEKDKKHKSSIPTGPGTELKKLLSRIGIQSKNGCGCSDKARHIDYMEIIEPGWAEKNVELIVDYLEEEAKKRKLPFLRAGAKVLVKLAIRRAKK